MPSVVQAFKDANDFVIGKIYALEANTVQDLYDAYARAYAEMTITLQNIGDQLLIDNKWTASDVAVRQETLRQIGQIMNRLDPEVTRILYDSIGQAYTAGFYGSAYVIDSAMSGMVGPSFVSLLPTDAVAAQIVAPYLGQSWVDRFMDNRAEFDLRVKRALVQSQIQGESMDDAIRRLRDELGVSTDQRKTADRYAHRRNFNRLRMMARSEIIRASNNGAVAIYEANSDVLRGWEFKASLDERTCPRCGGLDGRQFSWSNDPIDGKGSTSEILPPPIHPMCRCAVLPVLIDQEIERTIVGRRQPFTQWAQDRGISRNQYGQAFDFRGKSSPQLEKELRADEKVTM
jgi:SPP1 gp7 family putative phage head morphogenesis protein